jgi:hypothetical protein
VVAVPSQTEWQGCRQWVADAPEHAFIAHPPVDERLDKGGLTGARLTTHQNHATSTGARVVGPGVQLAELVIALSQRHSSR